MGKNVSWKVGWKRSKLEKILSRRNVSSLQVIESGKKNRSEKEQNEQSEKDNSCSAVQPNAKKIYKCDAPSKIGDIYEIQGPIKYDFVLQNT